MKLNTEMFKFVRNIFFLVIMALFIAQGCDDDDKNQNKEPSNGEQPPPNGNQPPPPEDPTRLINEWILEHMYVYYLWNTHIPRFVNFTLNPDQFFYSILRSGDNFSVIYDNFQELLSSLSGVTSEAGYHYNLMLLDENSSDVIGYVAYIKPGTPAEKAGLKRGDYFMQVNNTQITTQNYGALMQETTKPHTLGLVELSEEGVVGDIQQHMSLNVTVYEENPIFLDTVYHIKNKKIGYFVYNFFARDSEVGGIEYERQLNNLFGKYVEEGIDELIVDLRYNTGGTVITSIALASMISNRNKNDIFGYDEYNSFLDAIFREHEGEDYNTMYFLDDISKIVNGTIVEQVPINKLPNLNRVFMIVSERSASSSEMLINSLRPYMGDENVVLVGRRTYGKNVGSVLFYEDDPEKQKINNWGILPIVFKYSNKNKFSDFADGFPPDIDMRETAEIKMKPLGDIEELLLATTLNEIFGNKEIKRQNIKNNNEIISSATDLNPARNNMIMYDRKNGLFGRN